MEEAAVLSQDEFDVRCEWGEEGVRRLAPFCKVIVIVDVLSFSTCVAVAVERGARVYPYRFKDETAVAYAATLDALLAGNREGGGYSLSPASLRDIPAGARLVLPSPNGATLTLLAGNTPVLAGSLRNATAVANAAMEFGGPIGVIAAGERWPDGLLRPALEDQLGAGAVIARLEGLKSPEARASEAAFMGARQEGLRRVLLESVSGRELVERGWESDVGIAAELDATVVVPRLIDGAYRASRASPASNKGLPPLTA